jgi:hypothetical protein
VVGCALTEPTLAVVTHVFASLGLPLPLRQWIAHGPLALIGHAGKLVSSSDSIF